MGENEYGKSSSLDLDQSNVTSLKHLMMLLKSFFRASFVHLIKDTDSIHVHVHVQGSSQPNLSGGK